MQIITEINSQTPISDLNCQDLIVKYMSFYNVKICLIYFKYNQTILQIQSHPLLLRQVQAPGRWQALWSGVSPLSLSWRSSWLEGKKAAEIHLNTLIPTFHQYLTTIQDSLPRQLNMPTVHPAYHEEIKELKSQAHSSTVQFYQIQVLLFKNCLQEIKQHIMLQVSLSVIASSLITLVHCHYATAQRLHILTGNKLERNLLSPNRPQNVTSKSNFASVLSQISSSLPTA